MFVRMATGAGKTLCLFLAPLAIGEGAIGVTISPLSALMDQQVLVAAQLLTKYSVNTLIFSHAI